MFLSQGSGRGQDVRGKGMCLPGRSAFLKFSQKSHTPLERTSHWAELIYLVLPSFKEGWEMQPFIWVCHHLEEMVGGGSAIKVKGNNWYWVGVLHFFVSLSPVSKLLFSYVEHSPSVKEKVTVFHPDVRFCWKSRISDVQFSPSDLDVSPWALVTNKLRQPVCFSFPMFPTINGEAEVSPHPPQKEPPARGQWDTHSSHHAMKNGISCRADLVNNSESFCPTCFWKIPCTRNHS